MVISGWQDSVVYMCALGIIANGTQYHTGACPTTTRTMLVLNTQDTQDIEIVYEMVLLCALFPT